MSIFLFSGYCDMLFLRWRVSNPEISVEMVLDMGFSIAEKVLLEPWHMSIEMFIDINKKPCFFSFLVTDWAWPVTDWPMDIPQKFVLDRPSKPQNF